jgi:Mrp family chromosome partitioning ATPase
MGRILEALKQAEGNRGPTGEAQTLAAPASAQSEAPVVSQAEVEAEEIPFIEVGGPRLNGGSPPAPAASGVSTKEPVSAPNGMSPALLAPATPSSGPVPVAFQPFCVDVPGWATAGGQLAPELVAFHHPEHPISEQYRTLLTGLVAQLPSGGSHVLMATASRPELSTTDVLLNLAITLARQGRTRVAVLDANLRRPSVARRLGLPAAPGLHEVLAGTVSLQRAIQETEQPNLRAITAGEPPVHGRRHLAGDALRWILRHLHQRFNWVLMDAPWWDGRPEVVALGSACDAVYLLLPQAETQKPETAALMQLIAEQGSPLRGCILVQH